MNTWIEEFVGSFEIQQYKKLFSYILVFLIAVAVCFLVRSIVRFVLVKIATKMSKKTKNNWDDILLKNKFFHRLSSLSVPMVLDVFINHFFKETSSLQKIVSILMVIILIRIGDVFIKSVDEIYKRYEISKTRPIKGVLQVIKTVLYIVAIIVFIAIVIGESPIALLGGIGAMTAVTSLVFKDAILGFVAGIQLSANDMVRIGDWIEMPKYSADGTVIDLSLTTVKVENFDYTITTIPAYALVSDAFINWRGMQDSGGRRIKRALYLNAIEVGFCDAERLESLNELELIKPYLATKKEELQAYNRDNQLTGVNEKKLTNIGIFRVYMSEYLKKHSQIDPEKMIMVRQLAPTEKGLPLEIYAFTNTTQWTEYERIQSDIFDHLYAVAPLFGLSIFQQPSGKDLRQAGLIKE